MIDPRRVRVGFALTVLCCLAVLGGGYVAAETGGSQVQGVNSSVESAMQGNTSGPVVPPRDNITVVTGDSTAFVTDEGDGPRQRAELVAFAPNGSIYYYNESHTRYWDVDPVKGTQATVE